MSTRHSTTLSTRPGHLKPSAGRVERRNGVVRTGWVDGVGGGWLGLEAVGGGGCGDGVVELALHDVEAGIPKAGVCEITVDDLAKFLRR